MAKHVAIYPIVRAYESKTKAPIAQYYLAWKTINAPSMSQTEGPCCMKWVNFHPAGLDWML